MNWHSIEDTSDLRQTSVRACVCKLLYLFSNFFGKSHLAYDFDILELRKHIRFVACFFFFLIPCSLFISAVRYTLNYFTAAATFRINLIYGAIVSRLFFFVFLFFCLRLYTHRDTSERKIKRTKINKCVKEPVSALLRIVVCQLVLRSVPVLLLQRGNPPVLQHCRRWNFRQLTTVPLQPEPYSRSRSFGVIVAGLSVSVYRWEIISREIIRQ